MNLNIDKKILIAIIIFLDLILFDAYIYLISNCEISYCIYIIIYDVLFTIFFTFLFSFDSMLIRIISNILYGLLIFFYVFEIFIYKICNCFFPLSSIFGNAKSVFTNYNSEIIFVIQKYWYILLPIIILCFISFYFINKINVKNISTKLSRLISIIVVSITLVLSILLLSLFDNKNNFTQNVCIYGLKPSIIMDFFPSLKTSKLINTDFIKHFVENTNQYNVLDINFDDIKTNDIEFTNINNYIRSLVPSKKNKYTGIFKDKNVIMICAEAFSYYVVDKELTPTLYRLINNGFVFKDYYVQSWSGSTTAGEFAYITGLIANNAAQTMKDSKGKEFYFTLPKMLKNKGYNTGAFHNGSYNYYDRNETHKDNLGFDCFYGIGNGLEKIVGSKYINDAMMFEKTFYTYCDKQPFCMYYMTIDGHGFYNNTQNPLVNKYKNKVVERWGDKYKDQVINYICCQMGLEAALTKLIELLTEKNMLDNTVICLNADHFPWGLNSKPHIGNEEYMTNLYEINDIDEFEIDRNMPIIWSGCLENEYKDIKKEVEAPSSTIDILPTMLNLFGLKYDSRLLPGRDVFSDLKPFVVYNRGSFITDKGKYDMYGNFIPNKGCEIDENYINDCIKIANNKILYSIYVLNNDYFRKIYNYIKQ